jgi:hypothetical protein
MALGRNQGTLGIDGLEEEGIGSEQAGNKGRDAGGGGEAGAAVEDSSGTDGGVEEDGRGLDGVEDVVDGVLRKSSRKNVTRSASAFETKQGKKKNNLPGRP